MWFRLYTDPNADPNSVTPEWAMDNVGVYCINGSFNYPLRNGIDGLDFANTQYCMAMSVDGTNWMRPFEPIAAIPYAFAAPTATCLRGNGHIRITGAGPHYIYNDNFGIGTQEPDQRLTVAGNISQTGTIISSGTGNNYFAGNVGVGISNPSSKLQVLGGVQISSNSAVPGDTIVQVSTAPTNGTLLVVKGNGNIGIGTVNPTTSLVVNGVGQFTGKNFPTAGAGLEISYNDGLGGIASYDRTGTKYMPLLLTGATVWIGHNGAHDLNVDYSGNVGIGTTNPQAKLDVGGFIRTQDGVSFSIKVFTGTLDGSGQYVFNHGMSTGHWKVLAINAFYKGNSNEAIPMTVNYCDGSQIKISGGGYSRPYRVTLIYSGTDYGW